jgi:hypothetical protein
MPRMMNLLLVGSVILASYTVEGSFWPERGTLRNKPLCSGIKMTEGGKDIKDTFVLGRGQYCVHFNHVCEIDNVFGRRGTNAYYFSSDQREMEDPKKAIIEHRIPRVFKDVGAFCKEHLIYDWPRGVVENYEVFVSQEVDDDFVYDVISVIQESEKRATEARDASGKQCRFRPAFLDPQSAVANGVYQEIKTKALEKLWIELARNLGCDYDRPIEILVIKNGRKQSKRKTLRPTRANILDIICRDLARVHLYAGEETSSPGNSTNSDQSLLEPGIDVRCTSDEDKGFVM